MSIGIFVVSGFALATVLVGLTIKIAHRRRWFDHHDERKIHSGLVPRLGGIGFAATFIALAPAVAWPESGLPQVARFAVVLVALLIILIFGVYDDFTPIRPLHKLAAQAAAALIVVAAGYTFHHLDVAPGLPRIPFGVLRFPLTVIWIVGITNAFNLIDGVDGLAGGVAVIIAVGYALVFGSLGNQGTAVLCLVLAAAVGGFLVFNAPLPKARIFMGDGGSQFLGFVLAVLPLVDKGHAQASIPLQYAAALLLLPAFDTFAAIWRRTREGRHIGSPDKAHMHHKLMNLGFTVKGVLGVIYGLQLTLVVLVVAAIRTEGWTSWFLLLAAYALGAAFFTWLHYANRNALLRLRRE
jgi:UDP-GlcNAc:undecaprenyl-phosphate GlcNAc-1-phosphate transferase